MDKNINFPHLGIYLENVGKNISIFGFEIAFYGITIAAAMLAGLWLAMRVAKKTDQDPDIYFNLGMIAIVCALVGARTYYVIFDWGNYKDNFLEIFNLRNGGLAIYGGVIGGVAATLVYARVKKQSFWQLADTASVGLILGQAIGRWGNFFNREAFGGYTDGIFAMQLPLNAVYSWDVTPEMLEHLQTVGGVQYIQVHPTFLYESVWNLGGADTSAALQEAQEVSGRDFPAVSAGIWTGTGVDRGSADRPALDSGNRDTCFSGIGSRAGDRFNGHYRCKTKKSRKCRKNR